MNFKKWLNQFEYDDSPIGDLARDNKQDPTFPDSNSYNELYHYLFLQNASYLCLQSFDKAWQLFNSQHSIVEGKQYVRLEKYEIEVIENYWIDIEEIKKRVKHREYEVLQSGENPAENAFIERHTTIINGIEQLYNELDEDLKTIVDMRYWNPSGEIEDWLIIADRLYMSRNQVLKKRKWLIEKTAERIYWV
ncbi:YozE family protein [Lysinibacillus sp. NPDC056959]|uniref:YozE family protein n=1 Tax=Lysinibacillus sp. NPDC056959 TaxID=3345981 RepID=UPI00363D0446